MNRTRCETVYPAPRAALELVALGLTASEAVQVVAALPAFASNLGRELYLQRVLWNRDLDFGPGGVREFCHRHGLAKDEPRASGAVGGVRYVL